MGPMSLCVASYLPFSVNCFMNGHSYVAGELRRAGVPFRMQDNAIVRCADPDLLTAIAGSTIASCSSVPTSGPTV